MRVVHVYRLVYSMRRRVCIEYPSRAPRVMICNATNHVSTAFTYSRTTQLFNQHPAIHRVPHTLITHLRTHRYVPPAPPRTSFTLLRRNYAGPWPSWTHESFKVRVWSSIRQ